MLDCEVFHGREWVYTWESLALAQALTQEILNKYLLNDQPQGEFDHNW